MNYLIRENGRVKVYLIINQNFLYIDAAITGIKGIQGFLCSAKDRETIDFQHDVSVNLKACRARGRDFVPMLTKKTVYQYSIYFINRELMSLRFHIFTDCVCIKITVTGGIGDQYRWIHYALCKMTEA